MSFFYIEEDLSLARYQIWIPILRSSKLEPLCVFSGSIISGTVKLHFENCTSGEKYTPKVQFLKHGRKPKKLT